MSLAIVRLGVGLGRGLIEREAVKRRLTVLFAVLALGLVGTGSALAFDCIRASASAKGLQQSTMSGNWAVFDLSSGGALQQSLAALGEDITLQQGNCASAAYKAAGADLPLHFALGVGVAGRNGVLAHNNPNESVLGNLKGIDHLEESPIGAALFGAAAQCGIPVDEE
jgi:hypothetical protein